ncbi:hypothetical protein Tmar_0189 [Thermaerobacter marianensis DSM 12885]|uniref:Glycosyl transferase family 2 n=1 Tax=Thermaerobacter marianensis (strain ATCC 700841 / DSM 12885 / JCM 10246 / 7p75a) TaxID=644966 RepID=E6SLP7_THEM7|nr:hypothetical protein [Thermaerobacter marianensis]ADU50314.1 hypothetical protein Tmar_0189 [Thermaerobacter marianensis DSM 12885]
MGHDALWWALALLAAAGAAGIVGEMRASWRRRRRSRRSRRGEPSWGPWPLVVLVRDAASFIEGFVDDLAALAPGSPIVVVDCGSADETASILQRLRQRVPTLQVLRWPAARPGAPGPLEAALFVTGAPLALTIDLTNPAGWRWQDLRPPLLHLLEAFGSCRKSMTG